MFDAPEYASYRDLMCTRRLVPDHNPGARAIGGGPRGRFVEHGGLLVADGPSGVGPGDYFIYRMPTQVPDGYEDSFRWRRLHEPAAGVVYGDWSEPLIAQDLAGASIAIPARYELFDYVWLPRLDQWLQLLDEAGVGNVAFHRVEPTAEPVFGVAIGDPTRPVILPAGGVRYSCANLARLNDWRQAWPLAPTREEAIARLWMAVTGETD